MDEQTTYSAGCDACGYIAQTQADDDDQAARKLSEDLAAHNEEAHGDQTDVESIIQPVKAKMQKD